MKFSRLPEGLLIILLELWILVCKQITGASADELVALEGGAQVAIAASGSVGQTFLNLPVFFEFRVF